MLMIALAPGRASAEDDKQKKARARALLKQAKESYRVAEFAAALESYKEALKLIAHPDIAFNMGQCHRQLEGRTHKRKAVFYYKLSMTLYDKKYPGKENPRKAEVDKHLKDLEALLAKPEPKPTPAAPVATPAPAPTMATLSFEGIPVGARIMVDGKFTGKAPLTNPLKVPPGYHRVEIEADNYASWTGETSTAAGKLTVVRADMTWVRKRSSAALALGIVSAVLAAGALGVGVAGNLQHDSLYEENNNRENDDSAAWGNVGIAGYATAGGMAAASIVCWVLYGISGEAAPEHASLPGLRITASGFQVLF